MDNLSLEEKLKLSVFYEVKKICNELGTKLNCEFDKQAIKLISELTWKKLESWSLDLELFAKHAKRTSINSDDVLLLLRRHASLQKNLMAKISTNAATSTSKEPKKRPSKEAEKERLPDTITNLPENVENHTEEIDLIEDNDFY